MKFGVPRLGRIRVHGERACRNNEFRDSEGLIPCGRRRGVGLCAIPPPRLALREHRTRPTKEAIACHLFACVVLISPWSSSSRITSLSACGRRPLCGGALVERIGRLRAHFHGTSAARRYLRDGETVHHQNGGDDIRPENLELRTSPRPAGIRVRDAIEWARAILRRSEGPGAPPTTLTIARERPWRWRESNPSSRFSKRARQRHRFESTCHLAEPERPRWYSLARTGNRWFVPPVSYSCPTEEGHFGPVFVVQEGVIEGAPYRHFDGMSVIRSECVAAAQIICT